MNKKEIRYIGIISFILFWILIVLFSLILVYFYNYSLIQILIEISRITIIYAAFLIVINTRKISGNNAFINIIGISFLFIGTFDLLSILFNNNMNLGKNENIVNQIWIISRCILSSSLLAGCILNKKKANFNLVFSTYFILSGLLLLLILYFKVFPDCYIDGKGFTFFKNAFEALILALFFSSIVLVIVKRKSFEIFISELLILCFSLSILTEITKMFNQGGVVFDLTATWLNFFSFYLIYRIFKLAALQNPFKKIANDLNVSNNKIDVLNEEINEKNKDLEQIIYIISHDLRSPMTNIQGFTKAIEFSVEKISKLLKSNKKLEEIQVEADKLISEEISSFRKYIQNSIGKIDSIISGLLQVTQIGREAINISRIDLNNLVNDVLNSLNYLIKKHNISIELGNLPFCIGDKSQIGQVFFHLIDNAIKYSVSKKKVIIKISGEKKDDYNIYCIEDNGSGIEKKDQEVIFEIFKRINFDKIIGEGLGLAIVSKILYRHKSKIWLESEKGKGSKFYFTLPSNI